jgi:hypothetical protein
MRKFLAVVGTLLVIGALGWGAWWSWPILFPSLPSAWLSSLAKADAALVQNRPDLARTVLNRPPKNLPVMGWLQWEKRVQAVAVQTGAWAWASKTATAAQSQYPGNADLAAYLVWTLLRDHRADEAAALAAKVLKGTAWQGLELQARVEAEGLASGNWSALRETLADPSSASYQVYSRLASLDPDSGIRKNALLSALAAGQLDVAREHLGVLTPAQRDRPPFDRLQGLMAYDQGDWARAAALLKSLSQRQSETLLVLADVYLHLGDPDQARIIYDQLLADHPNEISLSLGVNRATLALDQGDPAKALDLLTRTMAAHPEGNWDKVRLLILEARFQLGEKDAVKTALDTLIGASPESTLSIEAELLKGRLFPDWSSPPRLWSLLHRHPDFSPLAERLAWLLMASQDYSGANRVLDLHEQALKKAGQEPPWWSKELRAFLLAVEDRLSESSEVFAAVPSSWRDATFYANWSFVSLIQAQQADPDARKALFDDAMENLTKALDLLPPASDPAMLKRRSLWLTRRGELQSALVPLQNPAQRGPLRSAAAEDFRQATQLDPDNLRASFLLRQSLAANEEKP